MGLRRPVFVLSGGAARGAAHLGFLAASEAAGVTPKAIVGASAGALMGALYSSWDCTTATPWERLKTLGYGDILRFAFSKKGIFSSGHLCQVIREALGKKSFEELPVPMYAVATNWSTHSLEILDSGDLAEGLAASCALPPIFTPVVRSGFEYLDGGVLSILPISSARHVFPTDLLIAVNVNAITPRNDGGKKGGSRGREENWISMALGPLWLSIERSIQIEQTFADFTLPIPAGDYPLFSLRFIEKTYALGYDEGMQFFHRRDVQERIYVGE